MTVTASIRVKVRRRQTCPYCGALYFYDTSPMLVKETSYSADAARSALLRRVGNLETYKNKLSNAPCPCCGRVQKDAEAQETLKKAGVTAALTFVATATWLGLANASFDGAYDSVQTMLTLWLILAIALTALGFYATRDVNKNAKERLKKFVERPQNLTAEDAVERLRVFEYEGRRCFLAVDSTILAGTNDARRAWSFAARILCVAAFLCGVVAACLWTRKTVVAPQKPAPYQNSFTFDVPFGISGKSLEGYCRVAERELTVKTADGEEVPDVKFTFGGESDWGDTIRVSESYWGPKSATPREIDPYDHLEDYKVTATARLGENRALAGKTVICEGTVTVESPRLTAQMVQEAQILLRTDSPNERLKERLNILRLHLLMSMERELGEDEELDDYIKSLNPNDYLDTFYNDFQPFDARAELTLPKDFSDREGYEAKMAKYEKEQADYEASRKARRRRVFCAKSLLGAGCVAFALCAILLFAGSAQICPKDERSEVVGLNV